MTVYLPSRHIPSRLPCGDDALDAINSGEARAQSSIREFGTRIERAGAVLGLTGGEAGRVANLAALMRQMMNAWPTAMRDPRTGATVPLVVYRNDFVNQVLNWAFSQGLNVIGRMADEARRIASSNVASLLHFDVVKETADTGVALSKFGTSRFRPVIRGVQTAQAAGKVAIRLPDFRRDVGRYFGLVLESEAVAAKARGTATWMTALRALDAILDGTKFAVDVAADLVAKPMLFLGDVVLKIAIGAGLAYGTYWYLTKD